MSLSSPSQLLPLGKYWDFCSSFINRLGTRLRYRCRRPRERRDSSSWTYVTFNVVWRNCRFCCSFARPVKIKFDANSKLWCQDKLWMITPIAFPVDYLAWSLNIGAKHPKVANCTFHSSIQVNVPFQCPKHTICQVHILWFSAVGSRY